MTPAPLTLLQARPVQRLRVQALMAVTAQLIRRAGGNIEADSLDRLIAERRRLLRELRNGIGSPRELGCLEAMEAAVEESDRALRRIMINEAPCTKASTLLS
jgi:hypothetical protein